MFQRRLNLADASYSHLKLGNLIAIYDDNSEWESDRRLKYSTDMSQRSPLTVTPLCLSPRTSRCVSARTAGTFSTWRRATCGCRSFHGSSRLLTSCSDFAAIEGAISEAKSNPSAPTIINLKTTIGFGSLKAGGHDVHGARE
jgi:hypothetical protein